MRGEWILKTALVVGVALSMVLAGCQASKPSEETSTGNSAQVEGGFKPGCGTESQNNPDCGSENPPKPEQPPKPEKPKERPDEPEIPRENRPLDDARGWVLATEPGGTFAVKATVRCVRTGAIKSAILANRDSAVEQAFSECD